MMFQSTRAREFRRSKAIRGYVGANGSGKTACAVWDLLPSLDAGRPVLSTARLLDFRDPRPCTELDCEWPGHPEHGQAHPCWVPFTDWRQLLEFRDGDVLLDEVAGVASSRESGSLPFQVARDLQQLRKRAVTLSFTAPAFARTEKIVRECAQLLTHCTGLLSVKVSDDQAVTAWRRNRLLRWKSYDAAELEKFTGRDVTDDSKNRLRPLATQLFRIEGSDVAHAYDSHDVVLSLGWANESGICLGCGGRRSAPRCSCDSLKVRSGAHESGAEPPAPGVSREDGAALTVLRPRGYAG